MLAFSVLDQGRRLTIRARAKVNLGLEVLGRRPDGYYELLSVLSAIDLADRVTLETTAGGLAFECRVPGVPATPENLAWRAADLVRREAGIAAGVRIRIAKAIPVAAGLGGGSADAAAVLAGLNRLWGVGFSAARLRELATTLGMDVPFFLGEGPALASGRGEQLEAVPAPRALPLVLVNPGFPLATREVYARVAPGHFGTGAGVRGLVAALDRDGAAVAAHLVNGLEAAAASLWPELETVKAALIRAGALGAVMSGSGPTVVGVAASRAAAEAIRDALDGRGWRVLTARTVVGPALSVAPPRSPARAWPVGRGQAERRGTLDPVFGGSNPPAPTNPQGLQ
jgi:4-diphosphocytidyl-2-C-methyl-D-erythritol kinase